MGHFFSKVSLFIDKKEAAAHLILNQDFATAPFFVSNLFLTRLTSDPRKVINSSYSKTKKKLKTTEDCL